VNLNRLAEIARAAVPKIRQFKLPRGVRQRRIQNELDCEKNIALSNTILAE
jgi:hypothetical protein